MKTPLLTLLLLSLATVEKLSAQPASWTSNDRHTIQACFIGVGDQSVLIEKDGVVFHVPFSRLNAQSIAQARRMGGQICQEAVTPQVKPATVDVAEIVEQIALAWPVSTPAAPAMAAKVMQMPTQSLPPATRAHVDQAPVGPPIHRQPVAQPPSTFDKACTLELNGRHAAAMGEVPDVVRQAITAGNFLQTKPYKWGGGHGSLIDNGYDCSGSVSHVLMRAGLLNSALTSSSFANYGAPGPGKWISIYAGRGHVFMSICGMRLDTGGRGGRGESGPRWCANARYAQGFTVRHPHGL